MQSTLRAEDKEIAPFGLVPIVEISAATHIVLKDLREAGDDIKLFAVVAKHCCEPFAADDVDDIMAEHSIDALRALSLAIFELSGLDDDGELAEDESGNFEGAQLAASS